MNSSNHPTLANDSSDGDAWEQCPEGELQTLALRLHAQERRVQQIAAAKMAGAAGLVTAALVVGIGLWSGPGDLGPMYCDECIANFDAYEYHLTDQQMMDSSTLARMEVHLEKCELCRAKFEQEHPGLLAILTEKLRWLLVQLRSGPSVWFS